MWTLGEIDYALKICAFLSLICLYTVCFIEEKAMYFNHSVCIYKYVYTHVWTHAQIHAHIKLSSGHDKTPNTFINSEKVYKETN